VSKYLFIAEKPSAMREFSAVYKKHKSTIDKKLGIDDIEFIALAGHIFSNREPKNYDQWKGKKWRELYDEHMPMIPDVWKIDPISGRDNIIKDLKTRMRDGFGGIICGTDSDIEGYGIYYMLMEGLGLRKYKTLRFFETSMTEKDILQSFLSMTDMFADPKHKNALNTYISRSRRDFLIGMNLSTVYTVRHGTLIRYGSVKSPTMLLIYENCKALDEFQQVTTFGIRSKHTEGFESVLLNVDDKKDRSFETKADADAFVATLAMEATVKSYVKKEHTQKAPKLYSLSDLQIDAAKQPYGLKPDVTLDIAQSLYEKHKILSYPRTAGTHLASGKAADLPNLLASIKDIPELKPFILKITSTDIARVSTDPNIINDKEVAKASHDALIPTGKKVDWDALNDKEKIVFLLVCKRFVAHFMPMFTEEKYTMLLENNGHPFKADGRKTIENGFNELYGKISKDVLLPEHKAGDIVKIDINEVYEKQSKPPARYTLGTIITAMKNIANRVPPENEALRKVLRAGSGIGTEATRSTILKELQESNYISVSKNAIYITDEGKNYIECIRREKEDGSGYDYGIGDPVQVGYWASKDAMIQQGEKDVADVMEEFYAYLNRKIDEVKSSGDPVKQLFGKAAVEANLPACPLCGGKVLNGKFGYYCSTYKESGCKLSIPNEMASKTLTDNQKKGLLEGKKIHAKGFKSKAGKLFEADIVLNKTTGKVEFDFGAKK
jgi:DNA topoisomerase-3